MGQEKLIIINYFYLLVEGMLCRALAAAAEVDGPVLVEGTTSDSLPFSDSDE